MKYQHCEICESSAFMVLEVFKSISLMLYAGGIVPTRKVDDYWNNTMARKCGKTRRKRKFPTVITFSTTMFAELI